MKKHFTILAALVISIVTSNAQTGVYVPQLAVFDNAMTNLLNTYNIPGGQMAITYQGRLVYNRGFGFANTATQDSVQPSSIFRLASISKTITGVAVMKLYEQNLINLDAKVFGATGILNDAIYQNPIDTRVNDVTVRELLQHSGGWNTSISGDPMFNSYNIATAMGANPPASPTVVVQYILSNKMLDFTPGTQYQYSNFGFCILGLVIEKITGQSYEDYVKSNVLQPSGISEMGLAYNLLNDQLPNEVNYYDYPGAPFAYSVYDNASVVPWPYGGFNIEAMDAHGGWVGSAADLCKFMVAIDKFATKPDILLPATIDTLTKPSTTYANYACGINVNANNNWWHLGSIPGTTTEFVLNRNQQINWAILCNSRDNAGVVSGQVDNLVWNHLGSITSWPTNDFFTAIDEPANDLTFSIYPNPVSSNLNIVMPNQKLTGKQLTIKNLLGETLISQKINADRLNLDISDFESGIYFVSVESEAGVTVRKFVKD